MKQWLKTLSWHTLAVFTLFISFPLYCTQNTQYIKPTTATPCPGEPCYTLFQYAEQYLENVSSNATLVFLPGDHTLNLTISVGTLSKLWNGSQSDHSLLTLLGSPSSLPEITSRIVCTWPAGFLLSGITELHITALAFISCGHNDRAAINILSVWNVRISNCIFQNNTNNRSGSSENGFGGAIHVHSSNLTLAESIFEHNFAYKGGALEVFTNTTATLSRNIFRNNSANCGGGFYAHANNTLTLSENTFQGNFAVVNGGALNAKVNNTLNLSGNTFQDNFAVENGGVLNVNTGNIHSLAENIFQNNTARYGGTLYSNINNTLNLSENTFQDNFAVENGGAVNANTGNTLSISENTFQNNSADKNGGALNTNVGNILSLSGNLFQNNSAGYGGALYLYINNTLTLSENTLSNNSAYKNGGAVYTNVGNTLTFSENIFHNNFAGYGGAFYSYKSNTLAFSDNTFLDNSADKNGGALNANIGNTLSLSENTFQNNSAEKNGGAVNTNVGNTLSLSKNIFWSNSAGYGGGLYMYINNNLTLSESTFQKNSADHYGGVISAGVNNSFTLSGSTLHKNSANVGGALFLYKDNVFTLSENTFQDHSANYSGGVVYAFPNNTLILSNNTFQSNSAVFDGGAIVIRQSTTHVTNNTFTGNKADSDGGALFCLSNSTLQVHGYHRIQNNKAQRGGAVAALGCQIVLTGDVIFENNTAYFGGGLYVVQSQVSGYAYFSKNYAHGSGGGIYASRSVLKFKHYIMMVENSALNGGGMLLSDDAKLYLWPNTTIKFTNNSVQEKGGALKVEGSNPLNYCNEESCEFLMGIECFFQIQTKRYYHYSTSITEMTELYNVRMLFQNNTAHEAGAALYGGSVDNCTLAFINPNIHGDFELYVCPNSREVFDYITDFDELSQDISSDPLYMCSCEHGKIDCSKPSITRSVYPGGTIEVSVIAYGQRNGTTPAVVRMIRVGDDITIKETEKIQNITKMCSFLNYTVQTRTEGKDYEMALHVGPCPPKERTGSSEPTNIISIHVTVLHCPPGFKLSGNEPLCNCAQRLERFTNTCRIADRKIKRTTEFWVGYSRDNISDGLILHPHCPFDYCTSQELYIAVDDSDKQCNNNRTGLLCGKCAQNFSVALGTNRCLQCSDDYLWLIVAFAFAGVALVLLLLVLRLTVAVGTINGLVFYTNILAMNSAIFFSPRANVLEVFIAWINLDLGIEICFYDGMDTYTKVWLQFVFPFYVWVLIGIIILISHYSSKVATILGNNPVAVLATLCLLSYNKLLQTVIAALSYTLLEYPNDSKIAVWIYDGNIRYLSDLHIPLFIGALVCLIFLFIPYTLLLIFSQWMRSNSGRCKIFSWVNHHRVLPFLEAYHAPYTDKHRHWTGMMLLVRCALFLLFACNALGDPSVNLLAIGSVTAILPIVYAVLGNRIYKTWYLNMLELSFITNLCILALATLYIRSTGGNQNAVTFTSIGVAFATFIGIVTYHSAQQIKHIPLLWKKLFRRHTYELVPRSNEDSDFEGVFPPSPPDPSDGCATVTHINIRELLDLNELREPCMEMDN